MSGRSLLYRYRYICISIYIFINWNVEIQFLDSKRYFPPIKSNRKCTFLLIILTKYYCNIFKI